MRHLVTTCGVLFCGMVLLGSCAKKEPAPQTSQENTQMQTQTPPADATQQTPEGGAATAQAKYVCPMHPQVTANAPGKCSECGMDLVLASAAADSASAPPQAH